MTEVKRVRMRIEGMTCAACERHVVRALEGVGAANVSASFRHGAAQFTVPADLEAVTLTSAVRGAGYRPLAIEDGVPAAGACGCCG